MSRRGRVALFLGSAAGLASLLGWGLAGLPAFGRYAGPYGDLVVRVVEPRRHVANAVTAVVFDIRGFDTLGEELLLFGAAAATALLLREIRERDTEAIVDRVRSDGANAFAVLAVLATFVLGLQVVAHGFLTPGGGFQGGVVLAAAFVFVFLGVEYRAYERLQRIQPAEAVESLGAGAYVALGLVALALGDAFLQNLLPLGTTNRLSSGGSAILLNWAAALAVAGGFAVIFGEYLQEAEAARFGRRRSEA